MLQSIVSQLNLGERKKFLSPLKEREITIDGYEVICYFNRCEYPDATMETLQIFGKHFTFLPFSLLSKLVKRFLGEENLCLTEIIQSKRPSSNMANFQRQIYVWSVYSDKDGKTIVSPFIEDAVPMIWNGFRFSYVDKKNVTFL